MYRTEDIPKQQWILNKEVTGFSGELEKYLKHYQNPENLTDCNTRLAWRGKGDMIRGWGPLLIKGVLVPAMTAHMPVDDPCHKQLDNPLNPCLPLPCWTPKYIRFILGNPLHFKPVKKD